MILVKENQSFTAPVVVQQLILNIQSRMGVASVATVVGESNLLGSKIVKATIEFLAILFGVILVAVLAQVSLPLPWTPVPITGQTFGVTLVALMWGRKRAVAVMLSYLGLSFLGLPILAQGSVFVFGATSGYLFGMLGSAFLIGELADRGYAKTWKQSLAISVLGSLLVFTFGLLVLAFFIPKNMLLVAGVLPFLPGDLIKNSLAAWIASRANS